LKKSYVRMLGLLCCVLVVAAGCKYNTLKFFFDGVPNPQKKKQAAVTEKKSAQAGMKLVYSEHGPYAARQCDACHDRAGTNNLVAPKEKLCYNCHEFQTDKKYIHGPLASGGCLLCHDPHSSKYQKLLVAEPATFCFYCHDPRSIPQDQSHARSDIQCTACHDAHMSDKKFLLK
jgi:predicted CXXCH cytochrome family protein